MALRAAASLSAVTVTDSVASWAKAGAAASRAALAAPEKRMERNIRVLRNGITHAKACRSGAGRTQIKENQRRGGARLCQAKAVAERSGKSRALAKIAAVKLR